MAVRAGANSLTPRPMSLPTLSRERLGLLLGFIGMAIFGGTLPATRIAVSAIDPIALTSLRTAIAGLCSLALLIVLRRPLPPRRLWGQLATVTLCVAVLFPFLMALVAVAITHERPKPLFWVASIAGAALVVAFAVRQGGGTLSPVTCCCSPRSPCPRSATPFQAGSPHRCRDGRSSVGRW
jgi:drug/metabolite transporter (DMT)-like permease